MQLTPVDKLIPLKTSFSGLPPRHGHHSDRRHHPDPKARQRSWRSSCHGQGPGGQRQFQTRGSCCPFLSLVNDGESGGTEKNVGLSGCGRIVKKYVGITQSVNGCGNPQFFLKCCHPFGFMFLFIQHKYIQ